jgi:phage terminase large subunit GpA-like protein
MRMPKRRARKTDKSDFVSWIEKTIHLPLGLSAEPGAITLPIFLREIAAAMTDPAVEKITLMRSARIGLSIDAACPLKTIFKKGYLSK